MSSRTRVFTVAAIAATSLAAPTAASAHSPVSPASVKQHNRDANRALNRVAELVRTHDDAAAAIELARERAQVAAAVREAVALVRAADTPGERVAAARALATAVLVRDGIVGLTADLVDEAGPGLQEDLAAGLPADMEARDRALEVLRRVMNRLPEQARGAIASVIAMIAGRAPADAATLAGLLQSGRLSPEAAAALNTAFGHVVSGLGQAQSQLEALLPQLPAAAQGAISQVIALLAGQQDEIRSLLERVLGVAQPGAPAGGQPGTTALPAGGAGPSGSPLPSGIPIPQGLPIPEWLAAILQGLPIPGGPR